MAGPTQNAWSNFGPFQEYTVIYGGTEFIHGQFKPEETHTHTPDVKSTGMEELDAAVFQTSMQWNCRGLPSVSQVARVWRCFKVIQLESHACTKKFHAGVKVW